MNDLAAGLAALPLELRGYDAPDGIPPLARDHIDLHNDLLVHAARLSARRDLLVAGRDGKRDTRPERVLARVVTDLAAEAIEHLTGLPPIRKPFLALLGELFRIFAVEASPRSQYDAWRARGRAGAEIPS